MAACAAACASQVAEASPSKKPAPAPSTTGAEASAEPALPTDDVGWTEAGDDSADAEQIARDEAIDAEMAASERSASDPAWETVPLGPDYGEIELAPDGMLTPQLAPDLVAPQCFVAEPVLSTDTAAASSCGLVPVVPLAVPTSIQDPGGNALASFHAALARARRGEGQARIVFYGASHVAADLYTGRLRTKLAADVGGAGPGFVLPARPWKGYRNEGVSFDRSRGFKVRRIIAKQPLADAYGLSGVALDAFIDRPASATFTLNRSAVQADLPVMLELYYWQRPHGGTTQVFVDGVRAAKISSAGDQAKAAYARVQLAAGAQKVELRTLGDGAVRIFGVSLEQERPGLVLDTLGIPGSRARYQLLWEDALYREHLAHRKPDLVVLAYGTNESGDDTPIARYEAELRRVTARVREVAPGASCLLIGPSDRPVRLPGEMFAQRPRTAAIIDIQRRVASELGCGFFDVVSFMGGPLSMVRWVRSAPALGTPDHVHFTRAGYERMADVLYDALLEGTQRQSPSLARVLPTQH